MPPLTEKDRACVEVALEMGLSNFALSFANRAEDVRALRDLVGNDARIISKIECRNGLANLEEIASASDALLIDRGDLSREVSLEQIPRIQKAIIRKAKSLGRPVYVATNLLESMVQNPTPTRAEINDIYNTLTDGADGLVLAAETAIGIYPARCATMIVRMLQEFEARPDGDELLPKSPNTLLAAPHGGTLIQRIADSKTANEFKSLPTAAISINDLMDCEQIANGTFSPLSGFMDKETLTSVLAKNSLLDGTIWTMPVLLQLSKDQLGGFGVGDRVALSSAAGDIHAVVDVTQIYQLDMPAVAEKWFGRLRKITLASIDFTEVVIWPLPATSHWLCRWHQSSNPMNSALLVPAIFSLITAGLGSWVSTPVTSVTGPMNTYSLQPLNARARTVSTFRQ